MRDRAPNEAPGQRARIHLIRGRDSGCGDRSGRSIKSRIKRRTRAFLQMEFEITLYLKMPKNMVIINSDSSRQRWQICQLSPSLALYTLGIRYMPRKTMQKRTATHD